MKEAANTQWENYDQVAYLDFRKAHEWARTSGPKPNPYWAMGPTFETRPNPQPINGGP